MNTHQQWTLSKIKSAITNFAPSLSLSVQTSKYLQFVHQHENEPSKNAHNSLPKH